MIRTISFSLFILATTGISSMALAEDADLNTKDEAKIATTSGDRVPEDSVERCRDHKDNDGDSHVDCADQDCQIFAICVPPQEPTVVVENPPVKQDPGEVVRPISLGIVPGLTTDGWQDAVVINHFALNLMGMGDALVGAELSILGAIRRYDVTGYQSAALFNINLDIMRGYQVAGVMNFNKGDTTGFQAAGITALALGDVTGFQGSGVANVSRGSVGFQGAGVGNIALADMTGFQGAGVLNVANGDAAGFQGSGVTNVVVGNTSGLQASGVANVVVGDATGLQASGVANVTTGQFTGAQLGLVNIGARVKGTQIGLVNIATEEMKGAPIGLVSYAGDGIFAPTFWMADSAMLNLGLKMGSRHVYGILGVGGHPVKSKRLSVAGGIGGHIELVKNFWLEIDLLHYASHGEDQRWGDNRIDFLEQARANLGYRFARQFSVYAGPSCNVLVSDVRREVGFIPPLYTNEDDGSVNVAVSIGLTAGIQWEPQFGRVNSRR